MFQNTSRISLKPEYNGVYTSTSQNIIKFHIPSTQGFISTSDLVLRSTIKLSGTSAVARPDPRCGISSLFRTMIIRTGNNEATLEDIQSYNSLLANITEYGENDTLANMKILTEGCCRGNNMVSDSLYFENQGDWRTTTAMGNVQSPKALLTEIPLHLSGVLNSGKVFPTIATGGINLQINLDSISRSFTPYDTDYTHSTIAVAGAVNVGAKAAIDDTFSVIVNDTGVGGVNKTGPNNNPFKVGMKVYYSAADGTAENVLGRLVSLEKDGNDNLQLNICSSRAVGVNLPRAILVGDRVFFKLDDVLGGYSIDNQSAGNLVFPKLDFELSNLELVLNIVAPPESYVKSLMKQVSTKGLNYDFKTFQLYRNTLSTTSGMSSQNIPANQSMAYSILSLPFDSSKYSSFKDDSFKTDTSGSREYQFHIDNRSVPTRPVVLKRLTDTVKKPEMLHLIELEKSLVNCGMDVRNLKHSENRFLIGRALSRYGHVSSLKCNVRLSVLYEGTGLSTKQFDNYICHSSRMLAKGTTVEVSQ